jgi:hypothetical protein
MLAFPDEFLCQRYRQVLEKLKGCIRGVRV